MKLAIVLLNWNGAEMLRTFLPILLGSVQQEGVEVIVADNGSTDHSRRVMAEEFPQVRLLCLDRNYGFAEGYNRALSQVAADYYLLLNSDIEVEEGWLAPLLSYMEAHPEVAACQPKIRSQRNKALFEYAGACGGYMDALGYPYCRGRIFDTVEEDCGQYDTVASIFWATGAALMIRSVDYWAHEGLDGRFFAHMEEIDLCWRLRKAGRKIVCVPESRVYHVGGATLKKENPKKTYLNFRNNLLMLHKNLSAGALFPVLLLRCALDYAAALSFLLKGDTANMKAVVQARLDFWRMLPSNRAVRRACRARWTNEPIPEQRPFSLLWSYYFRGRKRFSQMK
jgi:hypothetical protein